MKLTVDSRQRLNGCATLLLEFYKVLMGTFLTVFVPHACEGGRICSLAHNLQSDGAWHRAALAANCLCFLAFLLLYAVEVAREDWCIRYLDIDPKRANDALDDEIEIYPKLKARMRALNGRYKGAVTLCSVAHCGNVLISLGDMAQAWPGAAALAPLVSYVLLVTAKLHRAMGTARASLRRERAFSAYLTTARTYNAVDADHRV